MSLDYAAEHRRQMIARAREARAAAAAQTSMITSRSDESSSSSSEDSSSSEEEETFRPVFVPKQSRITQIEREEQEREAEEAKRQQEIETAQFLEQQRERAIAEATREEDIGNEDDDWWDKLKPPPIGDEDTEEAYQQWKIRELKRIMRYRGIQIEDEEEEEVEGAEDDLDADKKKDTIKGAFYRDMIDVKLDRTFVPEREQIAIATSKMKSSLFKQQTASEEVETQEAVKSLSDRPKSASLTERIRIGQKFTKKSGGMKDL